VPAVAPLVQLDNVSKRYYGKQVLDAISLDIRDGEVFGYIGPNGAGKTTTIKILTGLLTKFDGVVRVGGYDVANDRSRVHALIGFMPQGCGFQNWRTVDSALNSLGELSGVAADVRAKRIPELLERFGLLPARFQKVKQLSGGMAQKLGLIQALLHQPKLLVLDEPLEGLDPPSRNLLKQILRECQRAGTTVLFSSHILSDVEDVADRVGILHRGKLEVSGSLRELVTAFGLPLEIEIDFAPPPTGQQIDTTWIAGLGDATEGKPGQWRVRVPAGDDPDAMIHTAIERTLAAGGRLRKIGVVEPDLDDLFTQYLVRREQHAN
jgi:ABC-2 type transport system ATP-binding protein